MQAFNGFFYLPPVQVEGALYVYAHRNAHQRGLIILNRNSPKNYKEPIRADFELKIKTPLLIYKTTAGHIFGAWFYVEEECTRVGNLCCRLVSYLKKRGKNESGSQQPDNNNQQQQQQQGISILQNLLPPSALPKVDAQSGANIMSLLKKAEGGSAQVNNHGHSHSNGGSNSNGGGNHHHHNGNIGGHNHHNQNGKSKKQPLTPNNSNHNENGSRQQENGHYRKATGDSTPGVPVVHKPVPTKSLPSSVEQLFKSAGNPQQEKKQQQQKQGSSSTTLKQQQQQQHYSPMPESTTPKTPRGAQNGGGGGDLERLLGDLTRSSLESPPPSVALVETKVEALTPLNPCMASILSKLSESAQQAQREAEMARNSPTTEEALIRAFKGPALLSNGANNNGLEKKLTLITPEMLEESLSQGPSTPPQTLSRYELKSALLHLLDTDDDFLTKIHNAYVQGVSRRKL